MLLPSWPWLDVLMNWLAHGTWHLSAWQLVLFTLVMTHITIASVTIYLHRHKPIDPSICTGCRRTFSAFGFG